MMSARATGRGNSWGRGLIRRRCEVSGTQPRICTMGGPPLSKMWCSLTTPTDRHGQTSHLSEVEVHDLVAFLLSVEGEKSRVQDLERLE